MESFIGLDAHSKTCTFVNVDKNGLELDKYVVATSEKNILQVIRSVKGIKNLVFEEGNIAQWLYLLLRKEVDNLVV